VALVDSASAVQERYDYAPYGSPTFWNAGYTASNSSTQCHNDVLFTGQRYDPETGLYHYKERAMDPSLGRLLQRDGGFDVDGQNRLEYVRSSPFLYVDPLARTATTPTTRPAWQRPPEWTDATRTWNPTLRFHCCTAQQEQDLRGYISNASQRSARAYYFLKYYVGEVKRRWPDPNRYPPTLATLADVAWDPTGPVGSDAEHPPLAKVTFGKILDACRTKTLRLTCRSDTSGSCSEPAYVMSYWLMGWVVFDDTYIQICPGFWTQGDPSQVVQHEMCHKYGWVMSDHRVNSMTYHAEWVNRVFDNIDAALDVLRPPVAQKPDK
jgi:RHS repeat-associated protein